jgi:hypothetical protein
MDGASVHVPVITGVGPGVREGKAVFVGCGIFVGVAGIIVSVTSGVGVIALELLQELCSRETIRATRILSKGGVSWES